MDFSAPHMGYIYASYALTFVLLVGLAAYVVRHDRKTRAEAAELEASHRKPAP